MCFQRWPNFCNRLTRHSSGLQPIIQMLIGDFKSPGCLPGPCVSLYSGLVMIPAFHSLLSCQRNNRIQIFSTQKRDDLPWVCRSRILVHMSLLTQSIPFLKEAHLHAIHSNAESCVFESQERQVALQHMWSLVIITHLNKLPETAEWKKQTLLGFSFEKKNIFGGSSGERDG